MLATSFHVREVASSPAESRPNAPSQGEDSKNRILHTLDVWPHPIARQFEVSGFPSAAATLKPVWRVRCTSDPRSPSCPLALMFTSETSQRRIVRSSLQEAMTRFKFPQHPRCSS